MHTTKKLPKGALVFHLVRSKDTPNEHVQHLRAIDTSTGKTYGLDLLDDEWRPRGTVKPEHADKTPDELRAWLESHGWTVGPPDRNMPTPPSMAELEEALCDGTCDAVDGCTVEPDGTCPHGSHSWLRALGII